jgi:hypothetical protein
MLTFEQFYKEFLAEAVYVPHHQALDNLPAHEPTHGANKQTVVANEIEFFEKAGITRGKKECMLGVVGNGQGLASHEQQAADLRFRLKNVLYFEMNSSYFNDIAKHYITNHSQLGDNYTPDELRRHFKVLKYNKFNEILQAGDVHDRISALGPINPEQQVPTIINAELPVNGGNLQANLPRELQQKFTRNNVTHIDFDITTTPNVGYVNFANYLTNVTNNFFATYPNLKSLVQVYSWQRALPQAPNVVNIWNQLEAVQDFTNYYNNLNDNQKKHLTSSINYKLRGGGNLPSGYNLVADLNQALQDAGRPSLLQLYRGTGTYMLSIASIRQGNPNAHADVVSDQLSPQQIRDYQNIFDNFYDNMSNRVKEILYDYI